MKTNSLVLVNRLKSLNDASHTLQQQLVDEPKATELLYCIKGLVTQLIVENESSLAFIETARADFKTLEGTAKSLVQGNQNLDLAADMSALHRKLNTDGSVDSIATCKRLANIEMDYIRSMDVAFQAAEQPRSLVGVDAEASHFNRSALTEYLAGLFEQPELSVTDIDTLSGGFSKQTLKVCIAGGGSCAPETLVLRLDLPSETAFSVTTVDMEYPQLTAAWKSGLTVPRPYGLEASGSVLGRPFIVMDIASGKPLGTLFNYSPPDNTLGIDIAQQLARMHSIPVEALYVEGMATATSTVDQIKREIKISRSHWDALGRDSTILDEGFACLERNLSLAEGRYCLVHGDVGLHNILVENSRVTALLDWEFAKIGNPADDLGYAKDTLNHLMGWDNFLAAYEDAGGLVPAPEQVDFYRLLSLVRICVLVNQADAAFCAGTLPQIQYAAPGSYFLRKAMTKLGDMVQCMN